MNKKIALGIIALIVLVVAVIGITNLFGSSSVTGNAVKTADNENRPVKEFTMTSFTEVIDGKYYPQYSLKELTVNKGDLVRIKLTVTGGMHDFKIDEFNVFADTKELNKEYVVEFMADKAGEFEYYCTKPKHRELGHWGTIKVLEQDNLLNGG